MPYYHTTDKGLISFWTRKCSICGKKWPLRVLFYPKLPKDMAWFFNENKMLKKFKIKKGTTSYAKWADNIQGAGTFASWLPNWPRWARILSTSIVVAIISYGIYLLVK